LLLQQFIAGVVDFGDRIRNLEAEKAGRLMQTLGMLRQLENLAAIGAFTLEYGAGVVKPVRKHVNPGVSPFDELTIHPDIAVELVEGNGCHDNNLPRAAMPA